MKMPSDSESVSVPGLHPIEATTETATQQGTEQPASGDNSSNGAGHSEETEWLKSALKAARLERVRLGERLIQLEQDSSAEREANEKLLRKIEEHAAALEKAQTDFADLQRQHKAVESKATELQQEHDQLQKKLQAAQTAEQQARTGMAELTARFEQSLSELKTLRSDTGENESARKQLTADLVKEREANKLSRQKAEELSAELKKLRETAEKAEARARESAAQSKDWEKKVVELKKSVDEFARIQTAERGAAAQSAQRAREFEQQLKRAGDDLAASKTEIEKQTSARQRLEAESRTATEALAKMKMDLGREQEANKLSRQKAEELGAELKKLRDTADQAEARARESAAQSKEWEKKAAEFKKSVDELTTSQTAQRNVVGQSAQRVKELEQELKEAKASLAVSKADVEKQNSARQKLEADVRSLTGFNSMMKTDLAKEREANKLSQQKAEELSAQLKKLQGAAEQAEARARESAAQSRDWEKKAAELKKSVDEFSRSQTAERNAAVQSAQRAKELEQQLKEANVNLAASKADIEKYNSTRQKLEAENRSLAESGAKMKTDLAKEAEASRLSRQKMEELNDQLKNLKQAAEQAEARARESALRCNDWEKKAAELKKSVEELARTHAALQSEAAQSVQRTKQLEQQLKEANASLAAHQPELEKLHSALQRLEAENRKLTAANTEMAESFKSHAALQKRASELEQRVHEGVSTLAKMTAELQNERAERERADKCASSATAHLQQLDEKISRYREAERANRAQIAELEKTVHDRGDALARASAALRKESKERQMADKQLRLVSEMGTRLESNLESLEDAKKTFDLSLNQKDERLQEAERSLAAANSGLEKESAERRRLEGLLSEVQRKLETQSGESKVEISRLRAALELGELQRKRLEGDLLRSRDVAKSAEQGHGVTLDNLRRELRQPVEDLRQSACRLLEGQVTDEQKRVIEMVLEKALFLQVSLNATAKPDSEVHSPAKTPRADSRGKKSESK